MHQTLRIPEIFRNIFGHSSSTTISTPERASHNVDLAALARTCRTLKELALDLLWEELDSVTPLARCLPEVCRLSEPTKSTYILHWKKLYYMFSRPLNEAEWNTLRSYARRVRFIHSRKTQVFLEESAVRTIFNLAPFTDPLFPNLRSLYWEYPVTFPALHAAVPSLTSLYLDFRFQYRPRSKFSVEFFDAFGDRCPHIEELVVHTPAGLVGDTMGRKISPQICCLRSLRQVDCWEVSLDTDAIVHLSSISKLKSLRLTVHVDAIHELLDLGSILAFPSLAELSIQSEFLDTITSLLSHIRLPAIESLTVTFSSYASKRQIQAYWTGVREACPSNTLTCLGLQGLVQFPRLTWEVLYPCTAFSELRKLCVNLDYSVDLTDADLLRLVSPRIEELTINYEWGWQTEGGGITLRGLVQLLQQCPSLACLSLAIDTRTFTEIPEGMDVSFPPRQGLMINLLDSYILPELVPNMVLVFKALGLDSSMFMFWNICSGGSDGAVDALSLWEGVQGGLRRASIEQSVPSVV